MSSLSLTKHSILLFVIPILYTVGEKINTCIWQYNSYERSNETNPGVIPVDLRCSKGFLEWRQPKGGLQVKFKTPVDLLGSDFSVRLISKKDLAVFYEEVDNGLKILRGFEEYDPKSAINIGSKDGEAGLYVVARTTEGTDSSDNVLRIDYELERKEQKSPAQDCRMCSTLKMAELLCKGDFAVKAKIQNKYLHNDGQHVFLDLHVYHIYRQLEGIFLRVSEGSYHIGRVRMIGKCSPPKGRHHYIFLGKKGRGTKDAQVGCYMKFSLWKMIKHQIKCSGSRRRRGVSASKDIKDVYYQSKR
ncbi:meteorin-like protein [Rhopilema esculentum]|uniref:meteorin-like protein n=1 Tax=Rhopilema esculentum TaxID=499914 RepID=UPI0031CF5C09|eukprot:gene9263-16953_t